MTRRRAIALTVGAIATGLLVACSGQSCDELPELQAERDAARASYLDLAQSGTTSPADTEQADADLHALERRVYDVEQGCSGR